MEGHLPPRISIGLPVYNGEAYLGQAIESLLCQTFHDFELIVSDNCSVDATAEICKKFVARDHRVVYHRNDHNLGAAANYNRVVELAKGECFVWANHDDLWAESYLEKCITQLDAFPEAVLVYARSAIIDASKILVMPLKHGLGLEDKQPLLRLRKFHNLFYEVSRQKGWHDGTCEGLWIPVYGLIRTHLLRKTSCIGPYISSDTVLLEELLMLGPFIEIGEIMFFKRDHHDRSMRANLEYDKRHHWFTGKTSARLPLPSWRILRERVRMISRASVPVWAKLGYLAETLSFYMRHEWRWLIKDFLVRSAWLRSRLGLGWR
jgi:glycosyltransferase involved in cell wall biosynthesis